MEPFTKTFTGLGETHPGHEALRSTNSRKLFCSLASRGKRRECLQESREGEGWSWRSRHGLSSRCTTKCQPTAGERGAREEVCQPLSSQPLPCYWGCYWLNPTEGQKASDWFYRVRLWNTGHKVAWESVESRSRGTQNNQLNRKLRWKITPLPSIQTMSYTVT